MRNSTDMAALAARRKPAMNRLAALRPYQKLSPPARQFVKDLAISGMDLYTALARPNGQRTWDNPAVQACLEAFGYEKPVRPDPPTVAAVPYEPAYPPPATEQPCAECGVMGSHAQYGSKRLCSPCLCAALNIHRSVLVEVPALPAEPAPSYNVNDGPRCPQCHLVICGHARPVVIGGEPRPTHLIAHQVMPRLQDLDFWQREVDADKARRIVANANIDENCQESRILRELARRELNGEY